MLSWEDLNHLLVVKRIKSLIGGWWPQVDLFLIKTEDLPLFLNFEKSLKFKNPDIHLLFQKENFRKTFLESLASKPGLPSPVKTHFVKPWPATGINLYVFPIQFYKPLTGFLVLTGFMEHTEKQKPPALPLKTPLPVLDSKDKTHLMDLCYTLVEEVLTVQMEMTEKRHNIKSIYQKSPHLCYGEMVGKSKVMRELYSLLDKVKFSHNTILIQGENGTGKELIARSIHQNSPRKNEAFIAQNCSALNDNLLESELFGHTKGAFTGAYKDKKGLFETAHKGTFFLDEIGDTSLRMQVKILRVLQEGTFFPVGGVSPKKVDVRIIAATNKNLKQMIEQKQFREDLYYRLNVINIEAPPLRERKEDIPLLAEFFINKACQSPVVKVFTKKALKKLMEYPWPGNVRELQNEAQRLALFSGEEPYIQESFLSEKIKNQEEYKNLNPLFNRKKGHIIKTAVADLERRLISRCLVEQGWNKSQVAKTLGLSRAALISKIKEYGLPSQAPNKNLQAPKTKTYI